MFYLDFSPSPRKRLLLVTWANFAFLAFVRPPFGACYFSKSLYYPPSLGPPSSIQEQQDRPMFRKLINTTDDFTLTILRLILGGVFFAHGAQKALGWFGGYGFTGTMGFFTQQLHIPAV